MARLYDSAWLNQVIDTFAAAVAEQARAAEEAGQPLPVLAGLRTRGAHLADRVAARLRERGGPTLPVAYLDVTLYRDDLGRRPMKLDQGTELNVSVDDRLVVLIDDVLYTGRSARGALHLLFDFGRPARVRLYSVIDRVGERELPITADLAGARIEQTGSVRVRLVEEDGVDEVVLEE